MNIILDVSDFIPIEQQFKKQLPLLSTRVDPRELLLDTAFWLSYEELKEPSNQGKTELYTLSHDIIESVVTEESYDSDPQGHLSDAYIAESMSIAYALLVEKIYDYAYSISNMHLAGIARRAELNKIKFEKNLAYIRLLQNETRSY